MLLVFVGGTAVADSSTYADVLEAAGVKGGLVVHLGCGDGRLTATLAVNDRYLVHGLDSNADRIAEAKAYLRTVEKCGQVSVDHWQSGQLPYADELVNLVIAETPEFTTEAEMLRVLVPGGVLCIKRDGRWTKTVKPWPDEIDQWTHFLHDASNNAVAADTRIGPPRRMKWQCGPLWSRSHEIVSSITAMISANGRMFYVVDEAPTSVVDQRMFRSYS
jgi:SAM-dependent methyltransferase